MTVPGSPVLEIPGAVEAAVVLRRELGVAGDDPLPCVVRVAEKHLGLDVVVVPLPETCSGFYLPRAPRGLVATNATHAVVRQRFTVAHELGHHVLGHGAAPRVVTLAETPSAVEAPAGPSIGEGGAPRGDADVSTAIAPDAPATAPVPATPTRDRHPRERAADAFAAELLCPASAARSFVQLHASSGADGSPTIDFDLVVRMSCAFGMSAWAVLVRLGTAELLAGGPVRDALKARIDASEHIPRYAELGLVALEDELQEVARYDRPRFAEGLVGDVILEVTDPNRDLRSLTAAQRDLRRMMGLEGAKV